MNKFIAGVGDALLFRGDNLIGVAKTLTESTFNFSITAEEIRAGKGNALYGKYFHDSNLGVTLVDAMFNLEYIAASLGVNTQMGGLSVQEEELTVGVDNGTVTLTQNPVATSGSLIGWYKKPSDDNWSIGNIQGQTMTVAGAQAGDKMCVKYFYQNPNAKSIIIPTQYVPAELHVVIINDLYSGDVAKGSDNPVIGKLITDIPRLQMDGNQDLSLTTTGAATVSLTGSALATTAVDSCEDDSYYGTMTEQIDNVVWQDSVIALAVENGDIELDAQGSEALVVRVIYGGSLAAQRQANTNFTFAVENTPAATATGVAVSSAGVVTAGSVSGTAIISVNLTGYTGKVEPAYVKVTVA